MILTKSVHYLELDTREPDPTIFTCPPSLKLFRFKKKPISLTTDPDNCIVCGENVTNTEDREKVACDTCKHVYHNNCVNLGHSPRQPTYTCIFCQNMANGSRTSKATRW